MSAAARPPRILLRHRFEASLIALAERLLARAPAWLLDALSRAFALLSFDGLRLRRGIMLENLARAFPEWDGGRCRRVARGAYRHAFLSFAEAAGMSNPATLHFSLWSAQDEERLHSCRGLPFITGLGHLGNWEALNLFMSQQGLPATAIFKPLHNPILNQRAVAAREGAGTELISTRLSDREMWRRLSQVVRRGGVVGIILDQDAGSRGVFVPFFGHPASTASGAATLALRHGLPMVPIFAIREAPRRLRVRVMDPVHPPPGGRTKENIEEFLKRCSTALEDAIREAPEQYFWQHRRWKSRPKRRRSKPPMDSDESVLAKRP